MQVLDCFLSAFPLLWPYQLYEKTSSRNCASRRIPIISGIFYYPQLESDLDACFEPAQ